MNNLRSEVRSLLLSDNGIESFNSIKKDQKKSLSIEAFGNSEFDTADILLYRNDNFKTIMSKYLNKTMTGDQCMNRIFDMLMKGVCSTIDEIIDEEKSNLAFESICHSPTQLDVLRNS